MQKEVVFIFNVRFEPGTHQLSHLDLNLNNVLMSNGYVSSCFDIDSVRLMNSGYAIGFHQLDYADSLLLLLSRTPTIFWIIWMRSLVQNSPENAIFDPIIVDLVIAKVLTNCYYSLIRS